MFVRHPRGTLSLQLDTHMDVEFLKKEIELRTKLDVSEYLFKYGQSTLESGKPLSSYGIEKDSNINMVGRLRGGRRFQTLSQYFIEQEDNLLRTVELPDGSIGVEKTELGCLLLSSLIHLSTAVFVSGKTWNGAFTMKSFHVLHGRVRIKKKPQDGLNKDKLHRDCIQLSEIIKTIFVRDNVYPPYLKHLLQMLDTIAVDVFSAEHKLAFDSHISLILPLNYDGWHENEKKRFRNAANKCTVPEDWVQKLICVPLFHDIIMEGRKKHIIYQSNGIGAFILTRNYNTHAPECSWVSSISMWL